MNYVKKMCILRQIKQGFSGDGKTLSGLIKIEQYGKNLAVEVSVINFAPLSAGEYYCLLSDGKGKTEMLALRGKSFFNILSDINIANGFCGIICYVKTEIVPIAYGINGNGSYDWKRILDAALPPVFPSHSMQPPAQNSTPTSIPNSMPISAPTSAQNSAQSNFVSMPSVENYPLPQTQPETQAQAPSENFLTPLSGDLQTASDNQEGSAPHYNDETVAANNYYEEDDHAQIESGENFQNAQPAGAGARQEKNKRTDAETDADATRVLHPFAMDADGYYHAVKGEIDALFDKYPRDKALQTAFPCSEWVRIKGSAKAPEYLVGVVYENGKARYICYAIAAKEGSAPPEEIKNVCSFVPLSAYRDNEGFFVIFQSAASGECTKPVVL